MTLAATITVKKVYDNGKSGKVVDTNDGQWKFWKESNYGKAIPIETFPEGATLMVGYKVGQWNGKKERTITNVLDGQTTRPAQMSAPARPQAKQFRNSMDPEDARGAAATLLVAAGIRAQQIEWSADAITAAYKQALAGYDAAHKSVKQQKIEAEFNDEIQF